MKQDGQSVIHLKVFNKIKYPKQTVRFVYPDSGQLSLVDLSNDNLQESKSLYFCLNDT